MKNILILENVSELDPNFRDYLSTYHTDDNLNIIYNLSIDDRDEEKEVKQKQLLEGLSQADELVVCSSFYDNEQFENILGMLLKFKNIRVVRVLYLYGENGNNKFVEFLNAQTDAIQNNLKLLLNQCNIFEICCRTYELANGDSFFKKFKYFFDVVPVYYNERHNIFWHERKPDVPTINSFLYKKDESKINVDKINLTKIGNELSTIKNKIDGKALYVIDKKYTSAFVDLLLETEAVVKHQIESCEAHDFGDSKKLIKEKKKWLKILENIKKV